MALQSGDNLAHYEIIGLLGKGGMGEVYQARDCKLKRDVALKILPEETAADPERLQRFQREAQTVAGLNHPHIVTLHSVEEEDGIHFLTMELVEGLSLDRILKGQTLALPRIFEIGIAVADALSAAHEKHIVHRDLKPHNVMITDDGRVKVLDFGLAKASGSDAVAADDETADLSLTRDGSLVGTVPYMSPEQLRGEKLDHRSDLFSLGILLYELATGRRPFQGDSQMDVSMAILRDAPPPMTDLKPDLPPQLGRIVTRCLEKKPEDRYQSAAAVQSELSKLEGHAGSDVSLAGETVSMPRIDSPGRRTWPRIAVAGAIVAMAVVAILFSRSVFFPEADTTASAPMAEDNSIAVLAFVNMSDDASNEYFSDGISEELLNLLAKIPELRVISRSSSFSFKGQNLEIPEIARRLDVVHVLEGSVRKAGNQVRITAQLIDGRTDSHLWSETYDRTLDDIFAIQDEIAAAVVQQLRIELLGDAPRVTTTDPEAYALYLQAQHLGRQLSPESMEQSIVLYEQSLAVDPDYAPSWDGLAATYLNQANNGLRPEAEGLRLAREAAEKALALDPDFAPTHETLSWIALWHDNDLSAAAGHVERAVELDPTNMNIIRSAATVMDHLGRLDESIALGQLVTSRDPVNSNGHTNLGNSFLYARRWHDALSSFRTALRLSPHDIGAHFAVGIALLYDGQPQAALDEFLLEEDEEWRVKGQALALFVLGRHDEYEVKLAELIEGWGDQWPSEVAHVYAFTGQSDLAFDWLDKAIEIDEPGLTEQFLVPFFTTIHTDRRWRAFLERVGCTPEQLNAIEFTLTLPR